MAAERLANVPLGPLTTMGVGGPARWLWRWRDAEELRAGLAFARSENLPWWVLGGGSNVLIADGGLPGVVLQPHGGVMHQDGACVNADAGVIWDDLVAWSVARGLAGIECLSGIPGMVGAAPIQNIGAYGQDVAEVIASVDVLDTTDGAVRTWSRDDCAFGYRDSAFKRDPGRWLVVRVTFLLQPDGAPCLRYGQVADALAGQALPPGQAGLQLTRAAVLQLRRSKGMVVDAADPDSRSAGSFFMNPLVDPARAELVRQRLAANDTMPAWPARDQVKLSAAWLIERSGMQRGFGEGKVGLSRKHTLALVNRGEATTADVQAFADEVVARVEAACGVRLQREPVLLGD